jgi:hypothetical protein
MAKNSYHFIVKKFVRDETVDLCCIYPPFIEGKQFGMIKQL